MANDHFIDFACAVRPRGEVDELGSWVRSRRLLDRAGAGPEVDAIPVPEGSGSRARARFVPIAELESQAAQLARVPSLCEKCRANFKRALGLSDRVGCHIHVRLPLDTRMEELLFDAMQENARPERFETEQGNFIRAVVASGRFSGVDLQRYLERISQGTGQAPTSEQGRRRVSFVLDGRRFEVSVYGVEEALFMQPLLVPRALHDVQAFLRSFYTVVGRQVARPDGVIDPARNEAFWTSSESLREFNAFGQAIAHAVSLGVGLRASLPLS